MNFKTKYCLNCPSLKKQNIPSQHGSIFFCKAATKIRLEEMEKGLRSPDAKDFVCTVVFTTQPNCDIKNENSDFIIPENCNYRLENILEDVDL